MSLTMMAGFLFCSCFPIWPNFLKVFVWYTSVCLLMTTFFLVTIRALVYLFVWVLGYDLWILPGLFDERLSFVESFQPAISIKKTKDGQLHYRIVVALAFLWFCYWAVSQPSDFRVFLAEQGNFVKDIFEGKLISDVSQQDKDNIDRPKFQSLEELLMSLEVEEEKELFMEEEDQLDSFLSNLVDSHDEPVNNQEDL